MKRIDVDEPTGLQHRLAPSFLAAHEVSKRYPGVLALDGFSLDLRPGEVHALVGENGAGKSTLIRILTGDEQPDSGQLYWHGERINFRSPTDARRCGIAGIFQELALVPWMTVAENIVLGHEPALLGGRIGVSHARAVRQAREILDRLDVIIEPIRLVATLSPAESQLVEIARALAANVPVIVMDEPTSSLGREDIDVILGTIRRMREMGHAILFVSHKLDEVLAVADRITVMRGGRLIATLDGNEADEDRLIKLMVGRISGERFPARQTTPGRVLLEVRGLARKGLFEDINLSVREGEVLGVAGLVGARRTEIVRAICGIDIPDAGELRLRGERLVFRGPKDAIDRGIVYLPENRRELGLILSLSGYENAALPSLGSFATPFIQYGRMRRAVDKLSVAISIRGDLSQPVRTLSGGNQQKVVLAKWLLRRADVVIFDEPTRGIDVGAKREVYDLINNLSRDGVGVILVSSELPELLHMADRMVVMSAGRIYDRLDRVDFDENRILQAAFAGHTVKHQDNVRV